MGGYFPFCDCSSLRPICPTQDELSCIELKDPDDLKLVNYHADATSKTVATECIRQPYARSDRRTEELPSISQVVSSLVSMAVPEPVCVRKRSSQMPRLVTGLVRFAMKPFFPTYFKLRFLGTRKLQDQSAILTAPTL
ncbi:unnamed protein product [Porites evermanni]|uniref:Uncharacterized protein n=1 Tax=Porites evermanni TaxID=104178 RepID=A0ABN8LTR6_9CNID|nr:unnamed protein product [Porites evermanni]